jgi:hypothetical protein
MSAYRRHLIEMTLSMVVPWSLFFVAVRYVLPGAGVTLAWFVVLPLALVVMVVPMTALMRYRGHAVRDIVEMNAAMFAGMVVAMPVLRLVLPSLGIAVGLEAIFPIALVAMTAPMLLVMYLRRARYAHHHGRPSEA